MLVSTPASALTFKENDMITQLETMDARTMRAFRDESKIYRAAIARDIKTLRNRTGTDEGIDILMDIEIRLNDFYGWAEKEVEVLKHAEAKNA